jgi:hypothetical protein
MMNTLRRVLIALPLLLCAIVANQKPQATVAAIDAAQPESVSAAIQYLSAAMDQFHNRFPVYDDVSSAGNRFHTLTKFPSAGALVTINGSHSLDKHSGATSIRCTFTPGGVNFGGYNFQNGVLLPGATAPIPNFGTYLNAGIDLSGSTALTFWARGQNGGEVVDFFMGGVGWNDNAVNNPCTPGFPGPCPAPDSTPAVKITVTLSTQWTKYTIDLSGRNLSYVLGGFGWGVDGALNPGGAVFYIDDIQYELNSARLNQRLNEPRFIRSFTTLPLQPNVRDGNPDDDIDLVLRNAAFVYDNALAVLAFLSEGGADSLRRAKLIGDAIIYATAHDRTFDDGRLRSAYGAGDIALPPGWTPNGRTGTVPVAGFYEDLSMQFSELEESRHFDTGNNAWAMIALLALHRNTGDPRYLNAARLLGDFVRSFKHTAGAYQGFKGGVVFPGSDNDPPSYRNYASTEHNLDVFAAFTVMAGLTEETVWQTDAQHARQFVEAMWDAAGGCYLTGTTNPDERNTNPNQLPLDVQAWAALALPDALSLHPQLLECAEMKHQTAHDGFSGFDFNTDKDGVWFEGTAQMAAAYAWANRLAQAASFRQELNRAQSTPPFGDGFGIAASCHDALTTGFGFKLFRRLHAGATAWLVFADLGFNPYFSLRSTPACQIAVLQKGQSFDAGGGSGSVSVLAGGGCAWVASSSAPWISITSGSSGSGNGTVNYSIAANTGAARSGTITIAGRTFTVNQFGVALQYYPLPAPVRLLDTRPGESGCFAPGMPLGGNSVRMQQATGACTGIPANAMAITGNATVVNFTATGFHWITLYPGDAQQPNASNLNFSDNQIAPNWFKVKLAPDGTFKIFSTATTHLVIDVTGYYAPPGQGGLYFHPLPAPVRLLDTRPGETACDAPGLPLGNDGMKTVMAHRSCLGATIPSSAKSIVGNATVVNFISSGFNWITLFPFGAAQPNASNLNFHENHIVPNWFEVGLSDDGRFKIYSRAATHFIVDVTGYFSNEPVDVNGQGLLYNPLPVPVRLLETRPGEAGCDAPWAPLGDNATRAQSAHRTCLGVAIPPAARSVEGNATVVNFISTGFHWITLYPFGAAQPNASNLNFTANNIVPNWFGTGLSNDGKFNIYSHASTHFIVDLTGYFAP